MWTEVPIKAEAWAIATRAIRKDRILFMVRGIILKTATYCDGNKQPLRGAMIVVTEMIDAALGSERWLCVEMGIRRRAS
jgi:hypothetical protein